jgi:hypothetical protein
MHMSVFCIPETGFTYYFAYSAYFFHIFFCIFCILFCVLFCIFCYENRYVHILHILHVILHILHIIVHILHIILHIMYTKKGYVHILHNICILLCIFCILFNNYCAYTANYYAYSVHKKGHVHILHSILHIILHIIVHILHIICILFSILFAVLFFPLGPQCCSIRAAQHHGHEPFSASQSLKAHPSLCSSLNTLLMASQSTYNLYKMHNMSNMQNMQNMLKNLIFCSQNCPSLNHMYSRANQAYAMPKPYTEPHTMHHSRRPPLQRIQPRDQDPPGLPPASAAVWPSGPFPRAHQPQRSLHLPTPSPVVGSGLCASASLASLAPFASTTEQLTSTPHWHSFQLYPDQIEQIFMQTKSIDDLSHAQTRTITIYHPSPPCRDTPFLPCTPE